MDNFNNLPAEIISDIFTRLPAESVLDCKLVSKTWRNLIQHPFFFKMHSDHLISHHSSATCSTDSCKLSFLALAMDEQLYYFDYNENHETPIGRIRKINLIPPYKYGKYIYVGSFNGLICLRSMKESICIYNPMTKEYVHLPEPKLNLRRCRERCNYRWIGFGYLPSTNEYKVVLMYKEPKFVVVMVYTLGSRTGWRHIGKFRLQYNYIYRGHGIFANGALHWMHPKNKMILVFDLAEEKFREHISPPPSATGASYSDFGVLGGFLACAHRYYNPETKKYMFSELWMYKEKNGWTKEFIAIFSIPLSFLKQGCLLGYGYNYLNTGYGPSYFDIYDSKMSTMSTELPNFKEQFRQVFPHYHTFVSLKQLGEEGTKIMQEGTKIMQEVETKKRKRRD